AKSKRRAGEDEREGDADAEVEGDVDDGPEDGDGEDQVEGAAREERTAARGEDRDEVGEPDVTKALVVAGGERGRGADRERQDDEHADDERRVGDVGVGGPRAAKRGGERRIARDAEPAKRRVEAERADREERGPRRARRRERAADVVEAPPGLFEGDRGLLLVTEDPAEGASPTPPDPTPRGPRRQD